MNTGFLALLLALFSASRLVWFMPSLGNYYYLLLFAILVIICFLNFRNASIRLSGIFLFLSCAISIFFNEIPDVYRPWMRLGLFMTVVLLLGPFLTTPLLRQFRRQLFGYMEIAFIGITFLSFVGRFLGFSHMQDIYWCGITHHSMLLGIVAANAGVYLLYIAIGHNGLTLRQRWIIGSVLLMSVFSILGAGSRAAFLAFLGGGMVTLYISFRSYRRMILKYVIVAGLIMVCIWPILTKYAAIMEHKNHGTLVELDISSREGLWKRNWEAFLDNPWVGIGFAFEVLDTKDILSGSFGTGQVEPGSSWLAVLSMTGLLGAIPIFFILFETILLLRRVYLKNKGVGGMLYGLFAFYVLHMCAEGYIFAGGSMACFNFWLLMGMIEAEASDTETRDTKSLMNNSGSFRDLLLLLMGNSTNNAKKTRCISSSTRTY